MTPSPGTDAPGEETGAVSCAFRSGDLIWVNEARRATDTFCRTMPNEQFRHGRSRSTGGRAAVSEHVTVPTIPTGRTVVIRDIDPGRPWVWLQKGWSDFRRATAIDLMFGIVIAGAGALLIALAVDFGYWHVVVPLVTGFMLVGPILAVGLYDVSRRLERGLPLDVGEIATAWRANPGQIALMGFGLMALLLIWVRVAMLIFALFYGVSPVSPERFFTEAFLSFDSVPFVIVGCVVGFVLACIAFAISAISIPMLLDRDVDVLTAVATSVAAVRRNWNVMATWAALIVLFVGAGLVTAFVGLVIAMPLIGHATWHAYRDLVGEDE